MPLGRPVDEKLSPHPQSPLFPFPKKSGHLFVSYNFGGLDHVIGEKTYRVSDGRYHTVQFTRRGANSTLQVDYYPKVELFPSSGRSEWKPTFQFSCKEKGK